MHRIKPLCFDLPIWYCSLQAYRSSNLAGTGFSSISFVHSVAMAGQTSSYAALIDSILQKGSYVPCPKVTFLIDKPDDLVCEICLVSKLQFQPSVDGFSDATPAILPCGHIAGYSCLRKWLKTHHSCPFCRLDLKYELCDHSVPARPVDQANIHDVPRTIPEGGQIASQCKECRLRTSINCANTLWDANAERFREAREQFVRTRSPVDLAKAWALKVRIENGYAASFAEANVKGQAVEW